MMSQQFVLLFGNKKNCMISPIGDSPEQGIATGADPHFSEIRLVATRF